MSSDDIVFEFVIKVAKKDVGDFMVEFATKLPQYEIAQPRIPTIIEAPKKKLIARVAPSGRSITRSIEHLNTVQRRLYDAIAGGNTKHQDLAESLGYSHTKHAVSRLANILIRKKLITGSMKEGYSITTAATQ